MHLFNRVKGYLPGSVREKLRHARLQSLVLGFFVKRKLRKLSVTLGTYRPAEKCYEFSMICVKKTPYIHLAIKSINSLHYHNHRHKIVVYCDTICFNELEKFKQSLDYPQNVQGIDFWGELATTYPWQFCELDILTAKKDKQDIFFVDADTIWITDPDISYEKVTFYIDEFKFKDDFLFLGRKRDSILIQSLFEDEYLDYIHFNTSFFGIPKKFHSDKFVDNWKVLTTQILRLDEVGSLNQAAVLQINRLAEQIGASVAAQKNFSSSHITTLEKHPGGQILKSSYYGARNNVLQ